MNRDTSSTAFETGLLVKIPVMIHMAEVQGFYRNQHLTKKVMSVLHKLTDVSENNWLAPAGLFIRFEALKHKHRNHPWVLSCLFELSI